MNIRFLFVFSFMFVKFCFIGCNKTICNFENNNQNFIPCYQFIKNIFEDRDAFWFGNDFEKKGCDYENYEKYPHFITNRESRCVNERPFEKQNSYLTLGSRLFSDSDYNSDTHLRNIEGMFNVQFVSPPGNMSGDNYSDVVVVQPLFRQLSRPA